MVGGEDNAYELALGSQHGRIWDRQPKVTREGVTVRILNTHRRDTDPLPVAFQAVAFSGDGLTCAAADKRGHLYIFYLQLNRFSLLSREPVGPALGALCFTQRRHEEVLVASKTLVRAFDVDTHRNSADLKGHHREVTRVCSSGLAGLVLTQSSDVSILWDVKDWSKRRSLKAQSTPMCGACFTPLGDLCSILFKDSRIVLWRTSTLAFERELVLPATADGREVMLRHVATSNRHVVSAGTGGLLLVWSLAHNDLPKAVEVARPVSHLQLATLNREAVTTRTSDKATTVIALQDDGVLLMALLKTLRVVMTIDLRFRALVSFEISSNAKYLLAAVSDGCLELREVAKGIDYERKSIEQRIQLGAPEKLMQKVLKSRPDAWKAPGDAASRSRERPESDRVAPADGVGEELVLVGSARPSSSRRNSRRNPVQPQQRGANSHSKPVKEEKAGRLGDNNLKFTIAHDAEGATPVSSRRSRPPAWNAWDPPLVERALGPSSRSSSSSSSPDTVREHPAQTKSHWHNDPEHGRSAGLASDSRSPTKIYATDGGMAEVVLAPQISRKFRELLRERNVYPQKERPEIWRQILQLPYNRGAYESLEAAGTHPKFADLQEIHPGHTKSTLSGLTRLLSALAHWSNAWADVPYLPAIAFPFLKIFGKDPVLTFEIVVCVLLNWARSWLDELPGPPLRVLARLDDLLVSVDPMLHAHLRLVCERPGIARSGAVHLAVLWPLLQTLLTEVLPKLQWLQLWDHLLTHWLEPELLLAAIVAFLKSCRASLLLLPAHAPRAIDEWLRRPQKVHMPALLETMYNIQANEGAATLPSNIADPVLEVGASGEIPLLGAGPQLPLPKGRYPSISVFPHVVASARQVQAAPAASATHVWGHGKTAAQLSAHRDQLLEVRTAVSQLAEEENRFRQQQDELLKAEEARRKLAAEEEQRLFEEKRRLDDEVTQRRLQEVRELYEGVEKSLEQQRQLRKMEGQQLMEDLRRRHKERAYDVEARLKDEAVLNLEHRGMQTISELLMKRRDEESRRALRTYVKQRRREQELLDEVQRQAWRVEDERETTRLAAAHEQHVLAEQREIELRERREVEMQLRLEELERQLQLAQVARERVVRRTQQDAAFMTEVSDNMQKRRHELASRAERREHAVAIAEERRFQRTRLEEHQRLAEREASQLRLDMEVRGEQLSDIAADQARRDYEIRARQLQQEDADRELSGEQQLRSALKSVEFAKRQEDERDFANRVRNPDLVSPSAPDEENTTFSCPSPTRAVLSTAEPQAQARDMPPTQIPRFGGDGAPTTVTNSKVESRSTAVTQPVSAREQQLEDLIRSRETELENLWREFDREARECSEGDTDKAVFMGVLSPSVGETRPTARGSARRHARGGPLSGAWGDTSDESSSDAEAFRRLGSSPPGTERHRMRDRKVLGGSGKIAGSGERSAVFGNPAWGSESDES